MTRQSGAAGGTGGAALWGIQRSWEKRDLANPECGSDGGAESGLVPDGFGAGAGDESGA